MGIPYTMTENAITVTFRDDHTAKVIPRSHPSFEKVKELVRDPKATTKQLRKLMDIPTTISEYSGGNIVVKNGELFYRGFKVENDLAKLILKFLGDGDQDAAGPFLRFMERAFANPDPRAALDLYGWVARSNLPITPEGKILAWKAVGENYLSLHKSHRSDGVPFDHHPGKTVEEDRMTCDPDPNKTCSRGLHFCSAGYLRFYAGGGHRVVALEIDPADVVAFPNDSDGQKGRAWRYKVVGEVPQEKAAEFYPSIRVYRGTKPEVKPSGC